MGIYTNRILNTKKSFIREILKVTQDKEIISFAGGLPNPISFPKNELQESVNRILETQGNVALQYSTTEGHQALREWIANRYRTRHGFEVSYEDIIITTGSQQALDLVGKVLINPGDVIGVEVPGYLGAIQAFSLFEPNFTGINLTDEGLDINDLVTTLDQNNVKLLYTVPNFQNPSGITYSQSNREQVANVLRGKSTMLIEDDPYGELRFKGKDLAYIASYGLENSILFGSISKIITPGMRIGWICTKNKELMSHLVTAKQASDLHTNYFAQCIVADYLEHYDLEEHIEQIKEIYLQQSNAMVTAMEEYFPKEVTFTKPEGGMFLWATLPEGMDSATIFDRAIQKKVAFVPGKPFYTHNKPVRTMRLNYTNADDDVIYEGIRRLASVIY
jgi:2-aminoadipate transaminase